MLYAGSVVVKGEEMAWLWPWNLLLLLLVPAGIGAYVWMLKRRQRYAVRVSNLALLRAAQPRRSRWRRHLPFALFMLAVAGLITAFARPVAEVTIPMSRATIILAMDVSRSMCATDVPPNRLTVAQDAARAFVDDQSDGTQLGIVAFTGLAEIVVAPTTDKEQLRTAVDSFTTAYGTAIGSAVLRSIDAIAEVNDEVAPSGVNLRAGLSDQEVAALENVEGLYQPDIIVLLTDGANSRGPLPLDAAQQAADRRVRVYTIGFGTTNPGEMSCTREQLGSDVFGRGGGGFPGGGFDRGGGGDGGNFRRFVVLDEPTLRGVAEMTGGEYFQAENADQLLEVFLNLPTHVTLQKESIEISALFSILGAVVATLGVVLGMRWNRFP
jgi:Ca-activated chloride channel family protein